MLKAERQNIILNEVRIHSRVLLTDLADQLSVSEDTIRRDLKELDKQGKVKKVHGGAISNGYHLYKENEIYKHDQKVLIANKGVELLKDGQVILISGGTTNLELARLIPHHLHLTFFTPSLPIATQLLAYENVETVFLGGKLSREAQIAIGSNVIQTLSEIRADICFLGTGWLDPNFGLSEFDWEVVQLKKAMVKASKKVISMAISEKIKSAQRFKVCEIRDIDILITELEADDQLLEAYKKQGLQIR